LRASSELASDCAGLSLNSDQSFTMPLRSSVKKAKGKSGPAIKLWLNENACG